MKTVTFRGIFANIYVGQAAYSGAPYSFKTKLEVKPGDEVVVDTQAGLAVVKVQFIDSVPSEKATRWAFGFVDREALEALKKADYERSLIVQQLRARLKARKEADAFAALRDEPEAAGLLERLAELDQ